MTFVLSALAFAKRLPPWVYYIIAAIIAAGLIYRAGWNARDEKADRERAEYIAEYEQAADRARRAQQAVNDAAQARYDALAERIDREAKQSQVAALSAADRYIIRNRVQPCVAGATSAAVGPSPSEPAPSGDGAGATAIVDAVAVSADDIRICTTNTVRLQAAREWALGLAGE